MKDNRKTKYTDYYVRDRRTRFTETGTDLERKGSISPGWNNEQKFTVSDYVQSMRLHMKEDAKSNFCS